MRAIILALGFGFVVSTLAQHCVIEVSQDSVNRLVDPNQSGLPCDILWSNLLLHFQNTRKNLTTCEQSELTAHPSEPSFSDCQQKLENVKLDAEADERAYTGEMQKKIQLNEWDAIKYKGESNTLRNQITRISDELKSIYRSLILLNVQAGASKQALKYYHRYLEGQAPGRLLNAIVESVYRVPEHANERFEYLLDFARKLAGNSLRVSLYKLINAELQKHPEQRDSYLAMITALDLGKVAFVGQNPEARQLYQELFEPALKRLRNSVPAGNYDEVVSFATTYPDHFEQIENRISTLDTDVWNRADFNRFVTYPNRLPLAKQRLEAFRMILMQINQRNKHNFEDRLVKVAKELDECEAFVKGGKNERPDLEKLVTVKRLFATRDTNRDYEHYLRESKKAIE